jgi:hypothetical protein
MAPFRRERLAGDGGVKSTEARGHIGRGLRLGLDVLVNQNLISVRVFERQMRGPSGFAVVNF